MMLTPNGGLIRPLETRPAAVAQTPPALVETRGIGTVLKRRRLIVVTCLVGALGLVGGHTALQEPLYTSTSTIYVESARYAQATGLDVLGRVGAVSQVQTETEMLLARRVVEPVVDELDLHVTVDPGDGNRRPESVFPHFDAGPDAAVGAFALRRGPDGQIGFFVEDGSFPIAMAGPGDTIRQAGMEIVPPGAGLWTEIRLVVEPFPSAVTNVYQRISARTDPAVDLIELDCKATDPEMARRLCDEIGESYIDLRTLLRRAEASSTAAFLGEQVTVVRGHLAAVEDSLEQYALKNQIVALEEQASEEVRRLAQVEAERESVDQEYAALASLVERAEATTGGDRSDGIRRAMAGGGGGSPRPTGYRDLASFPTFLQHGAVSQLVSTLVDLENQRQDLVTRRQETSPDVQAIDTRIASVEDQLESFAEAYLGNLDSRLDVLSASLAESEVRLSQLPTQQVAFARLERQATLLGELFGFLETRRREAEVAEQVELPSVRILDHASRPLEPSSPDWALSLLAAVALGLGGGTAAAIYRDYSDPRVRSRREVEVGTGLPVISIIPSLPKAGAVFDGQIIRGRIPRSKMSARREEIVREAFRSLLTDLEFLQRQQGPEMLRTIAVVSAGPGAGKTFTASNIALARASVGANTLLVDADMRAGGVSEFFGIPTQVGLHEVLSGETSLDEVIRLMKIEKANVESSGALAVIPAGSPTSLSSALLRSEGFEHVLASARRDFDLVVVDTAPLNVLSDAMPVAAAVDGVLLVVRGGRTDRDGLEMALDRLARAGANVIGIVLNDSEAPRSYGVYNTAYALSG